MTLLALLLAAALQQPPPVQEFQASGFAGWGGRVVRGDWAPVLVDIDNRGKKDVETVVAVTWAANFANQNTDKPTLDGGLVGRFGPVHQIPVSLPANSRKRISLTILTPDHDRLSVWAFVIDASSGKTLARGELVTRPLDPQKRIVGIVGRARPDGFEDPSFEIATIQPDELPEEWQGYAALDALLWLDGRATEIRSPAQVEALRLWISSGGRFCVARANTVGLGGTPIADLLPVKLGAGREVDSLSSAHLPPGKAVVLESAVRKGAIRADTSGIPLVVEASRDAGRVIFVGFDPSHEPFEGWSGAAGFWKWLFQFPPLRPPSQLGDLHAPRALGSLMLAQFAGRFPDVAAPEIGGLFLLIILYLVVVGPLDYLLLRWLKRLELTWFTFPAYVVLFTLFILLVGGAFIQRAAHQREIAVVDHYPDNGFVRHRALSAVLAPADVIYKINDAVPMSSNFIQSAMYSDTSEKITDVRILRVPNRVSDNWLLNRGYTGLAMTDRCSAAPSPLTFTVVSQDTVEIKIAVKNSTSETFQGSTMVTSKGAYWISSIPPGESTQTGSRTAGTLREFVDKEGQRPLRANNQNPYGRYNNNPSYYDEGEVRRVGISERELNPQVRKALIGVSFPAGPAEELETLTGLARSLDARAWLSQGGAVLLAWPAKSDPIVNYEPKPGKQTSVTLYRFFQGPAQ